MNLMRLMDLVESFVGADDMKSWGGMWCQRFIRNEPAQVEEMVRWGEYLAQTNPDYFKTYPRPKWLARMLCKACGVKEIAEMPIGPLPK